jgi:hypothetical protein
VLFPSKKRTAGAAGRRSGDGSGSGTRVNRIV